ncbi:PEP-CTERM sorting domain-containing protein [Roseateles sp.]|uniref:PEP-CTERM sorting domain-containing protein n=1 Tax=Roseateles sp. TaxID=1971397 RepID=UPI003BACA7F8
MKTHKTLAVLAAALLAASTARAADALPAGTLITGTASGAATALLGLDHLFADEPGSNVTALAPADLEYLTRDTAVAIDFFADGHVEIWNNTGGTALPGSYTLSFSFAGLAQPITGFAALDVSGINGGSISYQVVNDHSVSVTFSNLSFTTEFGSFTAQINVAAVPEPASVVLLGAGLGLLMLRRARRAA